MHKRLLALTSLFISFTFINPTAIASNSDQAQHYDFDSIPSYQLTDKINMRFVTSSKFTVIQWGLGTGSKLPVHSHPNEQVTRILSGNVEVHTGDNIYHLHAGDVMIFPPNVTHGFIATADAIMYEQQTPIREDFLEEGFIERLSEYLKQNQ